MHDILLDLLVCKVYFLSGSVIMVRVNGWLYMHALCYYSQRRQVAIISIGKHFPRS